MQKEVLKVDNICEDPSWSFSNFSKKETNYASHGYHKYPEVYFNTLKQIEFKNKSFYVPNKSEEL